MNIKQFFRLAVVALALSATACTDEISSGEEDQDLVLKDGETTVTMNITGLNGKTVARSASNDLSRAAGDNITLPGEVKIDKLDVYCFVDLDAQVTSAAVDALDNYTLERVYHYSVRGNANDITLTPDGDSYRASLGIVPAADRKRAFILVANDGETRTVTPSADITAGNDRNGATKFSDVKAWNVRETDLAADATNLATPLVMRGTATYMAYKLDGKLEYDGYDATRLAEGISTELTRRAARIDISNPVTTGFTVTAVTLTGAKNAPLFGDLAVAGAGQTVAFAEQAVTNAPVINAALYALPMNANDAAGEYPSVVIKGKLGASELTLTAKFAGDPMTATTKGMQPNTRYVVNIVNSEGNISAMISIADWVYGETVDSEDIMTVLNSGATLAVEAANASLTIIGDDNKTLYIQYPTDGHAENTPFATITGTDNDKPVGIVLSDDCDWLKVVKTSSAGNPTTYQLQATATTKDGNRPLTANLSIITYDAASKKQVINEYHVYKEYTNIAMRQSSAISTAWNTSLHSEEPVVYLPPFGVSDALRIAGDILVPEGCTWLSYDGKTGDSEISDNIGKPERQVVVTVRWMYGLGAYAKLHTKEVTIVQSGTVDKTTLSPTHRIVLDKTAATNRWVKYDEALSTIIIAGRRLEDQGPLFYICGAEVNYSSATIQPILVQFGEDTKGFWRKPPHGYIVTIDNTPASETYAHGYAVAARSYGGEEYETNFTVTTYVDGAPVEKTYRLIFLDLTKDTVD